MLTGLRRPGDRPGRRPSDGRCTCCCRCGRSASTLAARLFGAGRCGGRRRPRRCRRSWCSATGIGYEQQAYVWIGYGVWTQLWASFTLPLAWGLELARAPRRSRYCSPRSALMALTIALHFETGYLALILPLLFWPFVAGRPLPGAARRAAVVLGGALLASRVGDRAAPRPARRGPRPTRCCDRTPLDERLRAPAVLGWLVTGQLLDHGRMPVVTVLAAYRARARVPALARGRRTRARCSSRSVLCLLLSFGRGDVRRARRPDPRQRRPVLPPLHDGRPAGARCCSPVAGAVGWPSRPGSSPAQRSGDGTVALAVLGSRSASWSVALLAIASARTRLDRSSARYDRRNAARDHRPAARRRARPGPTSTGCVRDRRSGAAAAASTPGCPRTGAPTSASGRCPVFKYLESQRRRRGRLHAAHRVADDRPRVLLRRPEPQRLPAVRDPLPDRPARQQRTRDVGADHLRRLLLPAGASRGRIRARRADRRERRRQPLERLDPDAPDPRLDPRRSRRLHPGAVGAPAGLAATAPAVREARRRDRHLAEPAGRRRADGHDGRDARARGGGLQRVVRSRGGRPPSTAARRRCCPSRRRSSGCGSRPAGTPSSSNITGTPGTRPCSCCRG